MAEKPRPNYSASTFWTLILGYVVVRLAREGLPPGIAGPLPSPAFGEGKQHAPSSAAQERGRGREATNPMQIPARGWKDVAWRVYDEFGQDRLLSVAAGVTYYALLALFPAIAALVSIYGLFADPGTLEQHLSTLSGVLPSGALDVVREQVMRIASKGDGTLGLSFIISLALSLWSANAGMKALFDALNIVYDEEEKRGFVALNIQSLTFTIGAIVFALSALGAIVALPLVLERVWLGPALERLIAIGRWPIMLAVMAGGLAVLYRYGPSRDRATWTWVTPGGLVAALLWLAVSMLFSWYVANFGSYNETYGSLGAVIGFMTWIWLSSVVVLLGAEINAEVEHQTAEDTTTGPRQPLGTRGAQMADTIGAARP